jgi:MoxR-like ATPase
MEANQLREKLKQLQANLGKVIKGKPETIELLVAALAADGNVLMEDVPGVGKTTLAKALAASIHGEFDRVQFTPDLLPTDILGSFIYNPKEGNFFFRRGPVFTNILLADEINRASPRTQSALLECMSERQVSIEGKTHPLPHPFLVIATQNPIEYQGTYPLPEAQLDRFAMQLALGYPDEELEMEILFDRKETDPANHIQPVLNCEEIVKIQHHVRQVEIEKTVAYYMLQLIRATRKDPRVTLGASPRALLLLSRCSQAFAFVRGRDYVLPDDVKQLAGAVLPHRLILENKAKYSGVTAGAVVADILENTKVPA